MDSEDDRSSKSTSSSDSDESPSHSEPESDQKQKTKQRKRRGLSMDQPPSSASSKRSKSAAAVLKTPQRIYWRSDGKTSKRDDESLFRELLSKASAAEIEEQVQDEKDMDRLPRRSESHAETCSLLRNLARDRPRQLAAFQKAFPESMDLVPDTRNMHALRLAVIQGLDQEAKDGLSPSLIQTLCKRMDREFFDSSLPAYKVMENKDHDSLDGLVATRDSKTSELVFQVRSKHPLPRPDGVVALTPLEALVVAIQHHWVHLLDWKEGSNPEGQHHFTRFRLLAHVWFGHPTALSMGPLWEPPQHEIQPQQPQHREFVDPDLSRLNKAHRRVVDRALPQLFLMQDQPGHFHLLDQAIGASDWSVLSHIVCDEFDWCRELTDWIQWEVMKPAAAAASGEEHKTPGDVIFTLSSSDRNHPLKIKVPSQLNFLERVFDSIPQKWSTLDQWILLVEHLLVHATLLRMHGHEYIADRAKWSSALSSSSEAEESPPPPVKTRLQMVFPISCQMDMGHPISLVQGLSSGLRITMQ